MAEVETWVLDFEEGSREMRELLGGKGAGLAEMTRLLGAERVPPGFTITTAACVRATAEGGRWPAGLAEQLEAALGRLEAKVGRRLGDPVDPMLVSARSGGRISMPGMMDTVLNLGLSDASAEGLAERTGNLRFALDSYRRLCQMFGSVVSGIAGERYERELGDARERAGVGSDAELGAEALRGLVERFKEIHREETGEPFPEDPREQLGRAVAAVFDSWESSRAVEYRRIHGIPHGWGTAVTVQLMVFGNSGERSGSGVAFSRDETTGAPEPSGDFLPNAQGEDVVAGIRNTLTLADFRDRHPDLHGELLELLGTLERHFGDMQDVEFTVEEGRLYVLQTRSAQRPAQAAVRFAVDAVAEGLLARGEALATIDAARLESLLHPALDPDASFEVLTRGVAASPGAARGGIVFTARRAVERGEAGEAVILVRPFTEADDVAGFAAARGVLTSEGGKASHAALVARGMGVPAVCGAQQMHVDLDAAVARVDGIELREGDVLTIDGTTGVVIRDPVPLVEPEIDERFRTVLGWADSIRRLGVRANADTPQDAVRAREHGAEGIGLCRTEHMFFGPDRDGLVKDMFVAAERWRRARARVAVAEAGDADPARSRLERCEDHLREALGALGELQRSDFEEILRAMRGRPVTIRLLDPPLHEFLPVEHFEQHVLVAERAGDDEGAREARERLALARDLAEVNPMLGTRGGRLGILYPPIYEMQVRAIIEAAATVGEEGEAPEVEIMLPLIAYETELFELRRLVVEAAEDAAGGRGVPFRVGTMIELPRACLVADKIAASADFLSFGTNDLTQTAIGLSRDDVEGKFLGTYVARRILDRSPFETLDVPGVGELVRIGAERARQADPRIGLGVCGEHGGDPDSVAFFDAVGLDYVSCSPFRVPIARLAAAQARVAEGAGS